MTTMHAHHGQPAAPIAAKNPRKQPVRTGVLAALVPMFLLTAANGPLPTPERAMTNPRDIASASGPQKPPSASDIASARSVTDLAWSGDGKSLYVISNLGGRGNIWRVAANGSWPQPLTRADETQSFLQLSPDGRTVFFAQDTGGDEMHDIYSVPSAGGTPANLTATPKISEKEIRPSPDGRMIAFTYKPVGRSQRDVAVMDLATRTVRNLTNEADPNGVWTPVQWSADSASLIVNREQTLLGGDAAIWRVDVASGRLHAITAARPGLRELAAGYVNAGTGLAVTSNRESAQARGGVIDLATGAVRWLAASDWDQRVTAVSPDGRSFAVMTNRNGAEVLSTANARTLREKVIGSGDGVSATIGSSPFSPDGKSLAYSYSTGDTPPDLRIHDLASGRSRILATLAMPALSTGQLPPSQVITYRSFDGTLVSGILTVPFNLRRDGSNPAIVMPHGGPTNATRNGFSRKAAYFAARGYMVLQPNFRGSTGYGKAFQDSQIMDMGGGDIRDVVAAKDFLVDTGFVDPQRVGITGASGGGWLTMLALGRYPGTFAAGVQVYGIIDWASFMERTDPLIGTYIRRLLGDPVKDRESYRKASPITYVDRINVPLLSLQGDRDTRVPMDQAVQVRDALRKRGVVTDLVIYRDEGHAFQKTANQIDEMVRTVDWFDAYMPAGGKRARPAAAGGER